MKTTPQYPQHTRAGSVLMVTGLVAVLGLAGCEKEGSAEKAGKTIDRTTENTAPTTPGSADRPAQPMQGAQQTQPSVAPTTQKHQSAGEYIDDSVITTKVKAALLNDPLLSASRIEVTTDQGIVKLSGTVDSEPGISRARELAGSQPGVKSVQADLSVTAAPGK